MMKRELSYDLICICVFGSGIEEKTDGGVKLIRFIQRTLEFSFAWVHSFGKEDAGGIPGCLLYSGRKRIDRIWRILN